MATPPSPEGTDWPGIVELLKAFLPGGLPIGALAAILGWRRWKSEQKDTVEQQREARIEAADTRVYQRMEERIAALDAELKRVQKDRDEGWRGLDRARDGWQICYHSANNNAMILLARIATLASPAEANALRAELREMQWPPTAEVLAGRLAEGGT